MQTYQAANALHIRSNNFEVLCEIGLIIVSIGRRMEIFNDDMHCQLSKITNRTIKCEILR